MNRYSEQTILQVTQDFLQCCADAVIGSSPTPISSDTYAMFDRIGESGNGAAHTDESTEASALVVTAPARPQESAGEDDAMRILLIPEFMTVGGGQKHFLRKALWLKQHGHYVAVASAGGILEAQLAEFEIPHLTVPALGLQGAYVQAWNVWGETIASLLNFVDQHKITVINAHPIVPIIAAREIALHRSIGVAYEFLGGQTHLIPSDVWIHEVMHDNFYTGSGPIGPQIQNRLHIDESLIRKIPYPVEMAPFQERPATTIRDTLGIDGDAFVVSNASRHDGDKIVHVRGLIDTLERLMPVHPNLHAVFAGDGTEHQSITTEIRRRLPSERTHILGMFDDMPALYHGSSVLYGMGSVCFEASAASVPVIVAPTSSLAGQEQANDFPANELTIGYFREYDFHSVGDVVEGVRFSTIDERLEPLIRDAGRAAEIAQRAHDIVLAEHHIDAVMEQWLVEYRRKHDQAMAGSHYELATHPSIRALYPTTAVQAEHIAANLIESVFQGTHAGELETADTPASPPEQRTSRKQLPRRYRVAIAVPHDPAAVTPPWLEWEPIARELRHHGIDAQIVATPDSADTFYDVDAVVAVSLSHLSTLQRWPALQQAGVPIVTVGNYRDDRMFVGLHRLLLSVLSRPTEQAQHALQQLVAGNLRLPDDSNPLDNIRERREIEQVQAHAVAASTRYITTGDSEVDQLVKATGSTPTSVDLWGSDILEPLPIGRAERFRERFGVSDFILVPGTIDIAGNQALLCMAAGRDIVMMGAPDADYQFMCQRHATCRTVFIPTFSDQDLADAVAASHTIAHAGLVTPQGSLLQRIAGSPHSCRWVISSAISGDGLPSEIQRCDPLNVMAIASALAAVASRPPVPVSADAIERQVQAIVEKVSHDGDVASSKRDGEVAGSRIRPVTTAQCKARDIARSLARCVDVPLEAPALFSSSVILVTRNARDRLLQILTDISNQNVPDTEYLILDCGSTDGTDELLAQLDGDVQIHQLAADTSLATSVQYAQHYVRSAHSIIVEISACDDVAAVIRSLHKHRDAA